MNHVLSLCVQQLAVNLQHLLSSKCTSREASRCFQRTTSVSQKHQIKSPFPFKIGFKMFESHFPLRQADGQHFFRDVLFSRGSWRVLTHPLETSVLDKIRSAISPLLAVSASETLLTNSLSPFLADPSPFLMTEEERRVMDAIDPLLLKPLWTETECRSLMAVICELSGAVVTSSSCLRATEPSVVSDSTALRLHSTFQCQSQVNKH